MSFVFFLFSFVRVSVSVPPGPVRMTDDVTDDVTDDDRMTDNIQPVRFKPRHIQKTGERVTRTCARHARGAQRASAGARRRAGSGG